MVIVNLLAGLCLALFLSLCPVGALPSHADELLIKGDHNYPPYEYLDSSHEPAGFNVDIARAVAREMGMNVQIRLGPWDQVRRELETGRIDALMGMFNTRERDLSVDFSIPHFIASYAVFVRKGSGITSLDHAEGKTILVQKGDLGHDYLKEKKITSHISAQPTMDCVLSLLARGEGDCAVVSRLQGLILIRRKGLDNILPVGPPLIQGKYCMAVKEGGSGLLAKLNEGLSMIKTSGEYDRIYEKWFGIYEVPKVSLAGLVRYIIMATAPILVLALVFFLWSRTLKKQVSKKTRELSRALQQIDDILCSMPSAVISLDSQGRVMHWNPKAEELTGISTNTAKSNTLDRLVSLPPVISDRIREVQETGNPFRERRVSRRDKGQLRYEDITVYALAQRSGVVIHMADVTEQVRLEEMMIQSEKMVSLGGLAAGIAHEINNPLAGMTQTAELIHRILKEDLDRNRSGDAPWDPDQINAFMASRKIPKLLSNIRKAGQKAARIVNNMLSFARNADDCMVRCRISRLLDETVDLAHNISPDGGGKRDIKWVKSYGAPQARVPCDPTKLQQVFMNIIQNAVYAMNQYRNEAGSGYDPCITLSTALTPSGDQFEIMISDNGPGLDKAIGAKIFDPFFTTKPPGVGTGLGLSISYFIVTQIHGGSLDADSPAGRGTCFCIRLPMAPREDEQIVA